MRLFWVSVPAFRSQWLKIVWKLQTTYLQHKQNRQTYLKQTDLIWQTMDGSKLTKTDQWLLPISTGVFQPIPSWLNWPITFNGLPSTDKLYSLYSENYFRLGWRNIWVINNSGFQSYSHPDDHTIRTKQIVLWQLWIITFLRFSTSNPQLEWNQN